MSRIKTSSAKFRWVCWLGKVLNKAMIVVIFIIITMQVGNFMVLNLFLALLLNSFNSDELKQRKEVKKRDSKLSNFNTKIRISVKEKLITSLGRVGEKGKKQVGISA